MALCLLAVCLIVGGACTASDTYCNFLVLRSGSTENWPELLARSRTPVIMKGFRWDATAAGGCSSIASCMRKHGDLKLGVSTGAHMALQGAERALENTWITDTNAPLGMRLPVGLEKSMTVDFAPWALSIRDFVTAMQNGTLPSEAYAFYEMRDTALAADFPLLRKMFANTLAHIEPSLAQSPSLDEPTFFSARLSLGKEPSGTGWHQHGPAMLGLIEGTKKWYAADMESLPKWMWDTIDKSTATHRWLENVRNTKRPWSLLLLKKSLFHCTQEVRHCY